MKFSALRTRRLGWLVLSVTAQVALALASCRGAGIAPKPNAGVTDPVLGAKPQPAKLRPETPGHSGGECSDGVDNDADGRVDFSGDPGCVSGQDPSEASNREAHAFWSWEPGPDSLVVYVSSAGDDANPGTDSALPVRTIAHAAELVRDGHHDFILLRRGDVFTAETLGQFKSGLDREHPLVIASYGPSRERPRIEIRSFFIDHKGAQRSFVALSDLHFKLVRNDPEDPGFDGEGDGILHYVGTGQGHFIEGCRFEYGSVIFHGARGGHYEDVHLRHSVIDGAYHVRTCLPGNPNGDPKHRPVGLYASHVEGLHIEGNLFDENGWNPDVESACATIYNHNAYLTAHRIQIENNVFARSSSIHVKLRADVPGEVRDVRIEDNFFVEGEIGVSIGGNKLAPGRFQDATIRRNVFSEMGKTRPTGRTIAWGIDAQDTRGLVISQNLFLDQDEPGVTRSWGVALRGVLNEHVLIDRNLFSRIQGASLSSRHDARARDVRVTGNLFYSPEMPSCLIAHTGDFEGLSFSGNRYLGPQDQGWFCIKEDTLPLDAWVVRSGESDARRPDPLSEDLRVNLAAYAKHSGAAATNAEFLEAARLQSRLAWDSRFEAKQINAFFRRALPTSASMSP